MNRGLRRVSCRRRAAEPSPAGRVAAGDTSDEVRNFLWNFLEGVVAGDSVHSGRGKTLTVLSRIWVVVPERAKPLRDAALRCIVSATAEQRVAIHWAMAVGKYPFFENIRSSVTLPAT